MAEEDNEDGTTAGELLKDAVKAALPIVVSAVVSVGFVAFAGKAILWTRFTALQVPGDQVVKAVPQGEAVATGASLLLIFGLLGVLATVGVYLVERGGRATAGMSRGLLIIVSVEALVAIWHTEGKSLTSTIVATEIVVLCAATIFWATFVAGLTGEREAPGGKDKDAKPRRRHGPFYRLPDVDATIEPADQKPTRGFTVDQARGVVRAALVAGLVLFGVVYPFAGFGWGAVFGIGVFGVALTLVVCVYCARFFRAEEQAAEQRAASGTAGAGETGESPAPSPSPKPEKAGEGQPKSKAAVGVDFTARGMALVLALTIVAIAAPWALLSEWWLGVSLVVVALLGWALWQIASLSKKRFVWYGLAVFISVPLFGTVMLMASNADEPKVQPMALIRQGDGPEEAIQGLYVTEGDSRVYFANLATEGCTGEVTRHSGRLLWVPKDEVVAMSVGPLQSVREASKTALEMSYDLTPAVETGGATITLPGGTPAGKAAAEGPASGDATTGEGAPAAEGPEGAEASPAQGGTEAGQGEGEAGGEAEGEAVEGEQGGEAEAGGEEGGEEEAGAAKTRLENVGPAVRPDFGAGLRIEPEIVSPGGEATLRMSAPNRDPAVKGFGGSRAGHNLRLGGSVLDISKEKSGAGGAEYIVTDRGRLIDLDKKGEYVRTDNGEFQPVDDAEGGGGGAYVRLADAAILEADGEPVGDEPIYVRVVERDGGAIVAKDNHDDPHVVEEVTLAGGAFEGRSWDTEPDVSLVGRPLERQAWHEDRIRFHVPDDASSGVVTVECDQLAGAPLLQVAQVPRARIAVVMRTGRPKILFDSTASRGKSSFGGADSSSGDSSAAVSGGTTAAVEGEVEHLRRSWKVDGVQEGHRERFGVWMPPRLTPYSIELTITNEEGDVDTAKLSILRLPARVFKAGAKRNEGLQDKLDEARQALEHAAEAERPTGVELDGFSDSRGRSQANLERSLARDAHVRDRLLHDSSAFAEGERGVPVEELGHGETCPLYRTRSSSANLHVDLFLLHEGVVVKPTERCRPLSQQHETWKAPPGKTSS